MRRKILGIGERIFKLTNTTNQGNNFCRREGEFPGVNVVEIGKEEICNCSK